jgi:hypothetical protein
LRHSASARIWEPVKATCLRVRVPGFS